MSLTLKLWRFKLYLSVGKRKEGGARGGSVLFDFAIIYY